MYSHWALQISIADKLLNIRLLRCDFARSRSDYQSLVRMRLNLKSPPPMIGYETGWLGVKGSLFVSTWAVGTEREEIKCLWMSRKLNVEFWIQHEFLVRARRRKPVNKFATSCSQRECVAYSPRSHQKKL